MKHKHICNKISTIRINWNTYSLSVQLRAVEAVVLLLLVPYKYFICWHAHLWRGAFCAFKFGKHFRVPLLTGIIIWPRREKNF